MHAIDTHLQAESVSTAALVHERLVTRYGAKKVTFLRRYLEEVYRLAPLAGLSPDWLVAQMSHETDYARSPAWVQFGNPAGIGITDGTDFQYRFEKGEIAARAQIVHMAGYVFGRTVTRVLASFVPLDPRWNALMTSGRAGTVRTVDDLGNGNWATDPVYPAGIRRHYAALIDPAPQPTPVHPAGGSTVATSPFRSYTVPGGKRPLFLPSWIKVQIKPVDLSQVRSRNKVADKPMSTFHDTGNPRTNAAGEYAWLAAGRPGGVGGGYEWINDDSGIIITGWFDEETWAQGDARGNRVSHAGELAFGGAVVWTTALEIACAMHGAVLEMEDSDPDEDGVLHQFWTKKWCSGQVLNRKAWPQVKVKIKAYYVAARAARAGKGTVDVPSTTYAPKMRPNVDGTPWDGSEDVTINGVKFEAQRVRAKTTIAVNTRQYASSESLATGPTLPAGTEVDLLGWVAGELVDGISEWWVGSGGSRVWAGGIDAQPKADPDYGTKPEAHPGLTVVNGRVYFDLNSDEEGHEGERGRKITIHRDGDLHRWADTSSAVTGALKAGQEVICHYWTRGEELPLKLASGETVGEMIWMVIGPDLSAGNRFWSGLTEERPD